MTKNRSIIMIDLETLDTKPTAVITQLAFVAVDMDDPDTEFAHSEQHLAIQPQFDMGRTASFSTLNWWMKQNDEARKKFDLSDGDELPEVSAPLQQFLKRIDNVIRNQDEYEIWARGPQFDIVLIESLAKNLGLDVPWKYDTVRDLRTLMSTAKVSTDDVAMRAGLIKHHALSDCRYQVDCLVESYRRLGAAK